MPVFLIIASPCCIAVALDTQEVSKTMDVVPLVNVAFITIVLYWGIEKKWLKFYSSIICLQEFFRTLCCPFFFIPQNILYILVVRSQIKDYLIATNWHYCYAIGRQTSKLFYPTTHFRVLSIWPSLQQPQNLFNCGLIRNI